MKYEINFICPFSVLYFLAFTTNPISSSERSEALTSITTSLQCWVLFLRARKSKSPFRSRLLSHRWQVEMKGTGCYELPGKSTSALSWPFNRFLPFLIFITLTQDINYRTHDRERSKSAMTWSTPHNSKWSNCWHLLESRWTIEI